MFQAFAKGMASCLIVCPGHGLVPYHLLARRLRGGAPPALYARRMELTARQLRMDAGLADTVLTAFIFACFN